MINNGAFRPDNGYEGVQLAAAQAASLSMGYEFSVPRFALTASNLHQGLVDLLVEVEISNSGVAPFYYPLTLSLSDGVDAPHLFTDNLETLQPGEARSFRLELTGVSAELLGRTYTLSLTSPILLDDQVIRFADQADEQGALRMTPEFGCSMEGSELKVGERLGDCVCDVDGRLIDAQAQACD